MEIYCKNCGQSSHCNELLLEDVRDWRGDRLGQKEICCSCQCERCTNDQKIRRDLEPS